ncbi:hypothetical protein C8R46DRAFT_1234382 [Mycena filopes]|nr:hypothetical protein C8R46DRAFT_1234382 [Mycena filopes]
MANPAHHLPQNFLSPVFLNRRRVIIACTNCRKRKIRCLTAEETPENPCGRCIKRGLKCEYITVTDQREDSGSSGKKKSKKPSSGSESGSQRSSSSSPQTPPAAPFAAPRPERSYSAPNPVLDQHRPYGAQYANPSAGYAYQPQPSTSGYPAAAYQGQTGGYNAYAQSPAPMDFPGYFDPSRTLPPLPGMQSQFNNHPGYGGGGRGGGAAPPQQQYSNRAP